MADDKKIIIDEDWKSQVQAEKERENAAPPSAESQDAGRIEPDLADMQMPPASFELLLTMLATEALVAMGHVPHPATQQYHVHRHQAKYLVDTIEVLREKTKGNLTPEEKEIVDGISHQLRMAFIESANRPDSPAGGSSPLA